MNSNDIQRQYYRYFAKMRTRWMDNDVYGHVNNVTYYSYFDTIANQYLIEQGGLNIQAAEVIGFVVASSCQYLSPIAHPETIEVGFRVNHLGSSSVQYGMAIFKSEHDQAAAHGTFTHVFVNRESGQPVSIPPQIRSALEQVLVVADT